MSDAIEIKGLRVKTHVGWPEEERAQPQAVIIDLTLHADLSKAGLSDDLADTVDYDAVIKEITELVASSKSRLLEHLGEEIATSISRYRLVDRVTVEIRKEEFPPPGMDLGGVNVRIERDFS